MTAARLSERVRLLREGTVARLTVGLGERHNALRTVDWWSIAQALGELRDADGVHVVTVSGDGSSFCAGSDINEWADATPAQVEQSFAAMEAACVAVESLAVPVLASIRGVAAGAGCQLALACDLRVMSDSAVIGMPISRLGVLVSRAFAQRIAVLAGPQRAREMLYTGRLFDAETAYRCGLVDVLSEEADLDATAADLVADIARQPLAAIKAAKAATRSSVTPVTQETRPAERAVIWPTFRKSVSRFLADHAGPDARHLPVERDRRLAQYR